MNRQVTQLRGVGPRIAELLAKLGITTVEDLLFHLPLHYQDRTAVLPIATLNAGDQKLIEGVIESGQVIYRRRRILSCRLADNSGHIMLCLYHFNAAQQQILTKPGVRLRCFGSVRYSRQYGLEMIHPEYRVVEENKPLVIDDRLTPVYPVTKGLSQNVLHKLISQALILAQQTDCEDILPTVLRAQFNLSSLQAAICFLHRPPKDIVIEALMIHRHPMQQRLAFEELMAQQLAVQQYRQEIQQLSAPVLRLSTKKPDLQAHLLQTLPFALTKAQQRVIAEINQDIEKPVPMMRLLQGDVGAGKTVIAMMALLRAVENGYQAVLMAPTELLAEQHLQVLQRYFALLSIPVGFLSGRLTQTAREAVLQRIANGSDVIVVGTHALFQADVQFARLGLVIIDEQHRFGVDQRLALKEKGLLAGYHPHQLMMTATPIPRTLAMTAYADLDVSVLDELPPSRKPVQTAMISNERREALIQRIKENCAQGRQVYWVCTLIADSEVLECQAAEATYEKLKTQLKDLRVGLLHGRLNKEIKETTIAAFREKNVDLLVATTVIEVGVDVPNASLMVIENAERLGLSQLHQLRGRVGRGEHESHCVLLYQKPLTGLARERLVTLRDMQDGFKIAEKDLAIRGPGEWLGTRQAGLPAFRIADIVRDQPLLPAVKQATHLLMQEYPHLVEPLLTRWLKNAKRYAGV